MATAREELGKRVAAARVKQRYNVKAAAELAGVARDTWTKIEQGKSVQDVSRQKVLDFLGLDLDGMLVVGANTEASGYVTGPGDPVEQSVTNEHVLAEIRAMREDVNALSRRVARIESGAQPVGGADGQT